MPFPCCCQPVLGPCTPFGNPTEPLLTAVEGDWTFNGPVQTTPDSGALAVTQGTLHPAYDWTHGGIVQRSGSGFVFDYADSLNYHQARADFDASGGTVTVQRVAGGSPSDLFSLNLEAHHVLASGGPPYEYPNVSLTVCRNRENIRLLAPRRLFEGTDARAAWGGLNWHQGNRLGLFTGSTGGRFYMNSPYRHWLGPGDPYNCFGGCEITCTDMYRGVAPETYVVSIPATFSNGTCDNAAAYSGDFVLESNPPSYSIPCSWNYFEDFICEQRPECIAGRCVRWNKCTVTVIPFYEAATRMAYFHGRAYAGTVTQVADCIGGSTYCDYKVALYESDRFEVKNILGFGSMPLHKISQTTPLDEILVGDWAETLTLSEP